MAVMSYLLIAHPDDEFMSWSLVDAAPDTYWVFIVLTRGERTQYGDGSGLRADLGERVPRPQPFGGTGSEAVRLQRIDSWHAFLDAMAERDPALAVDPDPIHVEPLDGPARGASVWVGEGSARVVFDLGDGALRPAEVAMALETVRALRGEILPALEEDMAVAGSYYNADDAAFVYTHRDHRAVHDALFEVDHDLPGPQLGRTASVDPDARRRGRTEEVDPQLYEHVMAIGEEGERLGLMQSIYGWLREAPWPAAEADDTSHFSRVQTFWERY